jgi:hypothetical protein
MPRCAGQRIAWLPLALAGFLGTILTMRADTSDWIGGDATLPIDWNTPANWSDGNVPPSGNNVSAGVNLAVNTNVLDLGGASVSLASGAANGYSTTAWALNFSSAFGTNSYTLQNGSIVPSSEGYVKIGGNVTLNLNVSADGTGHKFYTLANASHLNIGPGVSQNSASRLALYGGTGTTAAMDINAVNYAGSANNIWLIGSPITGTTSASLADQNLTVNLNANQTNAAQIYVGWTTGGNENKIVVRNGATLASSSQIRLGLNGSSAAIGAGRLVIGDAAGTGFLDYSGGYSNFKLGGGAGGIGILDIVNGTAYFHGAAGSLVLAASGSAGAQGVINVHSNGVLDTAYSFANGSSGSFNFDGGTLKVGTGSAAAQRMNLIDASLTVNIQDGGMIFNCNGKTETAINAALLADGAGGLTVRDLTGQPGKVTLNAVNTYTGNTWIRDSATLVLGASASVADSGGILINPNATFDVSGVSGGFTLAAGQWLSGSGHVNGDVTVAAHGLVVPGSGSLLGALTFNNNLTLQAGSAMEIHLNTTNATAPNATLVVNGTQTITDGTLTVFNDGPALNAGDLFMLLNQPTGGFTNVILPTGYTWTNRLAIDGSIQVLSVASPIPDPTNITYTVTGSQMILDWPSGQGWVLQSNSVSLADTNAWFDVPGATPPATNNIDPALPAVFYRLKY